MLAMNTQNPPPHNIASFDLKRIASIIKDARLLIALYGVTAKSLNCFEVRNFNAAYQDERLLIATNVDQTMVLLRQSPDNYVLVLNVIHGAPVECAAMHTYTARPGYWIKYLRDLAAKAEAAQDALIQEIEQCDALRFSEIDDQHLFSGSA